MNFIFAIALLVASYLIQSLMMPKVAKPKPSSFEDFDFPVAKEGTPEAVVFGDVWMPDWMVLWYGNFESEAIKQKGGKK